MSTIRTIGFLLAVLFSTSASAEKRIALLVGHPCGGGGLLPLRYVQHDVERLREVLELSGGFLPEDVTVSFGESASDVERHFVDAAARIRRHRATTGESTLFLFYYSGHAQDGELRRCWRCNAV